MKLPRWTVYPALGLLSVFLVTAVPGRGVDPNAGAALEARRAVESARADRSAEKSAQPVRGIGEEPIALAPIVPPAGAAQRAQATHERVIVLGIDGCDPEILAEVIARHPERSQNLAWLSEQGGGIHSLGTSTPPQSPVAWSNFITGLDPGGHGIYDFIHRDLTTRDLAPSTLRPTAKFFGLIEGQEPARSGKPFWQLLAENGVPADVWRMPANFPPERSLGVSFSGMLTPAIDSAYGESTFYTSDPFKRSKLGYHKIVDVDVRGGVVRTQVKGPPMASGEQATTPLTVHVDSEAGAVAIEGGDRVLIARVGEWTDFVRFSFDAEPNMPFRGDVSGIGRFYLRSLEPEFELYLSPINIDPSNASPPVSEPASAAAEAVDAVGLYYTQGMPEDVNALKRRLLDDSEFIGQSEMAYLESLRLLDHALDRHLGEPRGGLMFFYVSTVDLMSHMLWRHVDRTHPHHETELAAVPTDGWSRRAGSRLGDVLDDIYLRVDPIIGLVRKRMGDTPFTLVLMSDHGFAPYARKFSLNTWLFEQGYLVLGAGVERNPKTGAFGRRDAKTGEWSPARLSIGQKGVIDWERTRAYGMGFNGLYLNLEGREHSPTGPVAPGAEADALLAEIKAKLEAERDPLDGAALVLRADIARDTFKNQERIADAPDILVGYASGYGNSDQAALGEIEASVLADNMGGTFNGSHLMAPEVVPGVLLSTRRVRPGAHDLCDLTVEFLARYGVAPGPGMHGAPVLE